MTSPIDAATMADLRLLDESFMQDVVYLLRTPMLDDGAGGQYPGEPTPTGPLLGLFWSLRGDEAVQAAQLGQHGSYRMAFPVGTDVGIKDQVVVLGVVYNVVWVKPATFYEADQTVGLEEAGAVWVAPAPGYTPSLDFSDARNSMYVPLLGGLVVSTYIPSLDFSDSRNSGYVGAL